MDDNIHLEPCRISTCSTPHAIDSCLTDNGSTDGCNGSTEKESWRPCHILDFSDLSIGEYFSLIQLVFYVTVI